MYILAVSLITMPLRVGFQVPLKVSFLNIQLVKAIGNIIIMYSF